MKVQHVKDLVLYLPLDVPHILVLLLFGRKSAGNIKFLRKPFAKSCVLEGSFCSSGGVGGQRGRSVPLEHWGWVLKESEVSETTVYLSHLCWLCYKWRVLHPPCHPVFLCCSLYRTLMCAVLCTGP